MKHAALVFCAFLVMALPVVAQEDSVQHPDQEILLFGGRSLPYLPLEFRTYWHSGWNVGAGYGYSFEPGTFGYGAVYAMVEFNRFTLNPSAYRDSMLAQYDPANLPPDAAALQSAPISRATVSALVASLNFKGCLFSDKHSIAPYFLLGVGYLYYSADDVSADTIKSFRIEGKIASTFCWSAGFGIEIPLTDEAAAFIQGKSVLGVVDKTRQFFPLSAGVRIRM